MSRLLLDHVMDHAPADLGGSERALLMVLAHLSQDEDRPGIPARVCYPPRALLERRAGLAGSSLRKALQRLADRGYEVRVPAGVDRAGRMVYAYEGHATRYRVPVFPERGSCGTSTQDERGSSCPSEEVPSSLRGGPEGPPKLEELEELPPYPPAPSDPSVVDLPATGEEEEAAPVVVEVAALPDADHLVGIGEMVSGGSPGPGTPPAATRSDVEQRPPLRGGHLAPIPAQATAPVGPDPRRASVEQAANAARVAEDVFDDVVTAALADEETRSPAGRLARDPSWVARLERDVRTRRRAAAGAHEESLRRAGALECKHGVRDGLALTRAGELRCLECRTEARTGGRLLQVVR